MGATVYTVADVPEDNPIDLLYRRRIQGEHMLMAKVLLKAGCRVADHHHVSEQIAVIVSGKVKWFLGGEGSSDFREEIVEGGQVVVLPPNVPHGVLALEDTVIIDFLSPPGAMGVDSQKSQEGRAH